MPVVEGTVTQSWLEFRLLSFALKAHKRIVYLWMQLFKHETQSKDVIFREFLEK